MAIIILFLVQALAISAEDKVFELNFPIKLEFEEKHPEYSDILIEKQTGKEIFFAPAEGFEVFSDLVYPTDQMKSSFFCGNGKILNQKRLSIEKGSIRYHLKRDRINDKKLHELSNYLKDKISCSIKDVKVQWIYDKDEFHCFTKTSYVECQIIHLNYFIKDKNQGTKSGNEIFYIQDLNIDKLKVNVNLQNRKMNLLEQ